MNGLYEISDDKILRSSLELIKKYRVTTFFAIAILFTWFCQSLLLLNTKDLLSIHISSTFIFVISTIAGFGPSLAAVTLTLITEGRKGLVKLVKKMFIWKVNFHWYLFVLFSFAIIIIVSLHIFAFIGGEPPVFKSLIKWQLLLPYFLLNFFLGGPLGEELGWRGYALPILQEKNNSFVSSIIIGFFWSLWHLPMFFSPASPLFATPIPLYFLFITSSSILYTWVYNNTNGSVLLCLLFHTATNFFGTIFPIMPISNGSLIPIYLVTGLLIIVALTVIFKAGPTKLSSNRSL